MSKIEELTDINASYGGISKLNSHLDKIQTAFQNTLSRDGSTPNHMLADIDMNSQQLVNLGTPTLGHHAVTKSYLDAIAFDGSVDLALPGRIKFYNTYSDMQSETVDGGLVANAVFCTEGRAAANDGGFGFWRVRSGTTTADSGTLLNHSSLSFYFERLYDGILDPLWFSSELGAGMTAAANAMASTYGRIRVRPGSYTQTTQQVFPRTKNFYRVDMSGCRVNVTYSAGASIKIGDGTGLTQHISFEGLGTYIDQASSVSQPLFELRGVRGFFLTGFRGAGIYQICKWGDPADAQSAYKWWHTNCEWNMKSAANGGHDHGINANGSAGGYYETQVDIEGDQAVSNKACFYIDSNQGPARFDHMVRTGGIWKYFTWGLYGKNGRYVNIDYSAETRTDDMTAYGVYVEVTSTGTKGGIEGATFRGTFGGASAGGVRLISDSPPSGAVIQNVMIENMHGCPSKEFVYASTVGTGSMKQIHVRNNHIWDAIPANAITDCIIFDGDITESSIRGNSLDGKNGATYKYRYFIYNNTATTKSVWISDDNHASINDVNTAVVYDPNIGDMSIRRHCELNPDGSKRGFYPLTFSLSNFATSQTNVAMEAVPGVVTFHRVPNRCRVEAIATALNAAVAAGSLTIGYGVSAIDTNLDIVHTSGTGSYLRYVAGSAALAAGDPVFVRYTSDASLTAGIDGTATIWVREQ